MKIIKNLTILLLLTCSLLTNGQDKIENETETPFIEVTGVAIKEIVPDEIFIAITIKERHEGKEKITIEKQETDLKKALKEINIPLDNLTLSNADANFVKVKWTKKDVISKTEYVLKVWDALTVGKVFDVLDELKIVDAYILKVSHSKIEGFKKEVRIMAIKAAKDKADYLLNAIGQRTGKALKVYEINQGFSNEQYRGNVRGARSENQVMYIDGVQVIEDSDNIIQFKNINLSASIYVKFEIK